MTDISYELSLEKNPVEIKEKAINKIAKSMTSIEKQKVHPLKYFVQFI